jgi:ketosteroid isomerase-like protein
MGVADDKAVVTKFFATRMTDFDIAKTLMHDDATWTIPGELPLSGVFAGKQAIFDGFMSAHTDDFKEITSEVTRMIAENGTVVVEYHARGITKKDREYDTIYYYVVDVVDGKIAAVRQSLDTQYANRVIYT